MTPILVALLAGGCVTLVFWSVWALNREVVTAGADEFGESTEAASVPVRILLPYARSLGAALRRLLPEEGRHHPAVQLRDALSRRLLHAGNPAGLSAEEFAGLMGVGGAAALLGWCLMSLGLGLPPWWIPAAALAAGLGAFLPLAWLNDTIRTRRKAIQKTLPYAMDLLTLSVEAGLDFTVALQRLVRRLGRSPLGYEFARTLKEIQMGSTRKAALRSLADRLGMMEVSFLCAALIQADELGSSIGPILRIQGDQLRQRRFMAAEELAMKAPVKMIFPLAMFILPITMIVILGPVLIKYLPQIRGVAGQERAVRGGGR